MEKKHYYLIAVQFANPNPPSFTEPRVYDVIQHAIDLYNQKSKIVSNPKKILEKKIIDTYTLELKLESSSELTLPSKALRVFSKFLVDEGTLTPYIYGKALFKMSAEEINYVAETSGGEPSHEQNNNDDINEKEKGMKITIEDLLLDRKESLFKAQDKIDSILKSFLVDFNKTKRDKKTGFERDKKIGFEDKMFNEIEYQRLDWYNSENFDVINSFYTTFVCALVAYAKDIKDLKQYWNNLGKKWKDIPFDFGGRLTKDIPAEGDTELMYLTAYGLCNIAKETYAEKPLNPENIQHDILEDFKSTNNGELLKELAKLSHCVANFMPCPSWDFNAAKGASIAHDYLPLFVDLIQSCINEQKELEYTVIKEKIPEICKVEVNVLNSWKDRLIANVDEYGLSCYYEVKDGNLKGKPLFKGQSLTHPYPQNTKEVNECVSNMINCIKTRAAELLCRINEQETSK